MRKNVVKSGKIQLGVVNGVLV